MNNQPHSSQEKLSNDNYAINHSTVTNPMLDNMESMNSCPYYLAQNADLQQKQHQSINPPFYGQQKNIYDSNPYMAPNHPYQEKPIFQNTDISIKKKNKKPQQPKPIHHSQQQKYIKLNKNSDGDYYRLDGQNSGKGRNSEDCCNQRCIGECCTEFCLDCALQVCIQCLFSCICQAISK